MEEGAIGIESLGPRLGGGGRESAEPILKRGGQISLAIQGSAGTQSNQLFADRTHQLIEEEGLLVSSDPLRSQIR
jgi:hypothetical protein